MSASSVRFAHGVASGDPYTDFVILWTRISPPDGLAGSLDVQWDIADRADFGPGSIKDSGSFTTSADRDWTVKVEADGLSADTPYHYRFRTGEAMSMVGQTKTLPVGSDPVRLAVFSCANFTAAEQFAAFGRAAALHAVNQYDALLHLGDYIYEYGLGGYSDAEDAANTRGFLPNREIVSLDDYRQRYAQYHTDINLQNLRAAAPLIAIWDDHETANDSWQGGAENHQNATEGDWIARRDAALKAYDEWLPIRDPGQRQPSDGASAFSPLTQAYRSFNFGDVLSLHMLATRLTARDEQLAYPDAAAVQAHISSILADPALVAAYAAQLGITPPADPAAVPAFANALAPIVTQELVLATVQQAWGDPSRDLIGDSQLAWQVLGQQVLMQSMAIPAELLLNAGNPSLLDKYAAPLQKLATGTPGVTAPGLEKDLPGADAYIRAVYPDVDGLDGLNAFSDLPQWGSETVVAASDYSLSLAPEATPEIGWQPGWRELDLVFGLAIDAAGGQTLLNPADVATLPRSGVQLADVSVLGSSNNDRIFAGVGSLIHAAGGSDELFNSDSQGTNLLIGGAGADRFLLRAVNDRVIGGDLIPGASAAGLSTFTALVDRERDSFLIDSSDPGSGGALQIHDYEPGVDVLLVDGVAPEGEWSAVRQQLQQLGITVNAAPQLNSTEITLLLQPGVEVSRDLGSLASDPDGNLLQLVKLEGPAWITTSGTTINATAPVGVSKEQLAAISLRLAFRDGQAVVPLAARLTLNEPPSALALSNTTSSLPENTSTATRLKVADIVITDDALGSNTISLTGADADSFEVNGSELFLKAGTALNFEAKTSYTVTVSASDSSLPGSRPVSAAFALAVSDVNELPPGTTPVKGAFDFNNTSDRSQTFLLDVDSTNLNGKLFDPSLLPKTGDFRLTLTKGGFSGDLPEPSSSKDVIKLEFLNDGSQQEVVLSEQIVNERGGKETIASSARGILPAVVNNYIHTRGGDDEIIGSGGVDYIRAGAGDDIIDGGAGNDVVRSGIGNDRITLGPGADKVLITRDQLQGRDILLDFRAQDALVLGDGITVLGGLGSSTLRVGYIGGAFQELQLAGTSRPTWNQAMVTTVWS